MKYVTARWGEVSTVIAASGASGVIASYLLGQITGKQAAIGLLTALASYLLPETKTPPKT